MLTFQHVINIINVMVYIMDFFLSYIFQRLCVYTSQFGVATFQVLSGQMCLMQGCQAHFHRGPHQPRDCLQRVEIILGLYECNYSLTVKELKLHSAL